MNKIIICFSAFLILIVGCAPKQSEFVSSDITAQELRQHIKYLASDELRGRKAGEQGNTVAAEYIANEFRKYGVQPSGDKGSYFQHFDFLSDVKIGDHNKLTVTENGKSTTFKLNYDFRPMGFSQDTSITAQLAFVGYGISADSLHYNDYSGIDVTNKIVVMLRYSPSPEKSKDEFEKYSSIRVKAFTAREKGAAGMMLMTGPLDDEEGKLISFSFDRNFGTSGIASLTLKWTVFDSILHLLGKDLKTIQQEINSTKAPHSFELPNITASIQSQLIKVHSKTANVTGYLEGSDSTLKKEIIVIGAHFDHLGIGGENSGSLSPDTVAVHHGADDNASGTAALLEIAQCLSAHRQTLRRSFLFIGFSAEELGTLGSGYYVKNPIFPLNSTAAMLNMDMIGRLRDSALVVDGIGTSPKWEDIVKKENIDSSLHLKLKPDGFGPSDHASFYGKEIPVINFFTNSHEDYHRPSDTWDKINYDGEQRIAKYVMRIATDIANDSIKPIFTRSTAPSMQPVGGRSGVRVSLGVIPDFTEDVQGFKIIGTRPGSPAEKAGLKGGDIILKFGGKDIKNIYDFTFMLGEFKPGDEVEIIVKRGNEQVNLKAKLAASKN
jgi:aminopeptidase YwaD